MVSELDENMVQSSNMDIPVDPITAALNQPAKTVLSILAEGLLAQFQHGCTPLIRPIIPIPV
jgi:hypothetical protein